MLNICEIAPKTHKSVVGAQGYAKIGSAGWNNVTEKWITRKRIKKVEDFHIAKTECAMIGWMLNILAEH